MFNSIHRNLNKALSLVEKFEDKELQAAATKLEESIEVFHRLERYMAAVEEENFQVRLGCMSRAERREWHKETTAIALRAAYTDEEIAKVLK